MHRAIAAAVSSISASVTSPSFRTNRVSDTDFTWNASAPESFERSFSDAAGRKTNQERFPKSLFQIAFVQEPLSPLLILAERSPQEQVGRVPSLIAIGTRSSMERAIGMHTARGPDGVSEARLPDRRRVTWRPPAGRTAGSGDLRRTKQIRNESSRDQRAVKANFAACQSHSDLGSEAGGDEGFSSTVRPAAGRRSAGR